MEKQVTSTPGVGDYAVCQYLGGQSVPGGHAVCHAGLSVHCCLVVTCWERANLMALLGVMFSCVFVTFPCVVLGQVWNLIVSISDLCLIPYFEWEVIHLFLNEH